MSERRITSKDIAVSDFLNALLGRIAKGTKTSFGIPAYINRRVSGKLEIFRTTDSLYNLRIEGTINWEGEGHRPSIWGGVEILQEGDAPTPESVLKDVCGGWNYHLVWNDKSCCYRVTTLERRGKQFTNVG